MSDTSESDSITIQPNWIKLLILASEREAAEMIGLKLVTEEVRSVVWNMACTLGCRTNGVPGRAGRLLERYFYFLFRSYEKIPRGTERTDILESVKSRLMLIIACCVQLSAKMNSADACISPTVLRVVLVCKGVKCTVSDIVKTEAEVYAVIGHRIPLWTSVEIGEQLAHEIGISSNTMTAVTLIVDLADYLRDVVEGKMRWAATGSSTTTDNVSTLHLSAAAVLVAARLEPICTKSATNEERLARLVSTPLPYLTCLADIIYAAISVKHQNKCTPLILKRKRTN